MHAPDQRTYPNRGTSHGYRRKRTFLATIRRASLGLLAAALLAAAPGVAVAVPGCSATVTAGLAFGTYDVFSAAPLNSTGRIRLNCPKGQNPQVTIDAGNSGRFAWRELSSGTDVLRYNVFQDPAMSVVWGDGTDGSLPYVSPTGNAQLVIYGQIPARQDVSGGSYSDLLTVTVFL